MTRLLAELQHHTSLDAALLLGLVGALLATLSVIWSRE